VLSERFRHAGAALLFAAHLACGADPPATGAAGAGGEPTGAGGNAAGGMGAGGDEPPPCPATAFGPASDHVLPTGYPANAFEHLAGAAACGSAKPGYGLVDLDGDRLADLVVTDNCADPRVGRDRWLWYRNDGAAFVDAGPWALPDYGPDAFDQLASSGACEAAPLEPRFGLTDLDADGLVDLVVTDDCIDASVGRTHWRMHRNSGAGFAAASTDWTLPDYGPDAFEHLAGGGSCGKGLLRPAYGLTDLDGDGAGDLVVSDNCFDETVGRTRWLVHQNTGAGFEGAADWGLPDYGPAAFEHLAGAGACGEGLLRPGYALEDLDGDERPDLVVTKVCADGVVGRTRWLWHQNTGAAFAPAQDWSLPDYGPAAFEFVAGAGDCRGGALHPAHALIDLDGDEMVDLVISDNCSDPRVGRTTWLRHVNSAAGFANDAVDFGLPDYGPDALEHVSGAGECEGGDLWPSHGLLDLNGDRHIDLVVSDNCSDGSVGHTRWLVHAGSCDG
jgi:hypothetical protein